MNLKEYIEEIDRQFRTGIAREHSYRPALQQLISSMLPHLTVTNEPARIACGAPDFILAGQDGIPVAFIEAKDIDDGDLDGRREHREQFNRYKSSLDHIIFTDYLDFHLYDNGELTSCTRIGETKGGRIVPVKDAEDRFSALISRLADAKPQTITSVNKLAIQMASKARLLASTISAAFDETAENYNNAQLWDMYSTFRRVLLHDITPADFADIYAQTIAYGMFAARLHDNTPDTFSRMEAATLIPKTNPFLRNIFQNIAGYDLDPRISWIVDALASTFRATDMKRIMQGYGHTGRKDDPMIHFYEDFLSAYDPRQRKAKGVWYTPQPIVRFIIRAVDSLLIRDFGLPLGLADYSTVEREVVSEQYTKGKRGEKATYRKKFHRVQLLDPATGTGTFLAEAVSCIYSKFSGMEGMWQSYVEEHLLPRLNGFELLMASYAVAHLKLDMLLSSTGYTHRHDSRLRIYLTNSLEECHPDTGSLFAQWLSSEANEANRIKRDTPVMVMLGNPPYSVSSNNNGEWITSLISDYKKDLNERNIQPLSDDYIKFIRLGQHYIERNGEGILAYISNNSFIDGIIHRRMREQLLRTFDTIYILDLHGNSKKKETAPDGSKDENVFDIMQGVSINIFVRTGRKANGTLAKVLHHDLFGKRQDKYGFLDLHGLTSIPWQELNPAAPHWFFVPKDFSAQEEYEKGFKIDELFINNCRGVMTSKDIVNIWDNEEQAHNMAVDLLTLPEEEFRIKYQVGKDSRDWSIARAKADVIEAQQKGKFRIISYLYRPFEIKKLVYTEKTNGIVARPRYHSLACMLHPNNIALSTIRINRDYTFCIFCHRLIADKSLLSSKDNNNIFPLYNITGEAGSIFENEEAELVPNFDPAVLRQIEQRLGETVVPLELFDYIYAVLHSPSYREKYREFLKIDFPRIPYPEDARLYHALAEKGSQLRRLHLMDGSDSWQLGVTYPVSDTDTVETVTYSGGNVHINPTQYFGNVAQEVWDFYIGGYQPARKWLKDRTGKKLGFTDIIHYRKIVFALENTIRLMREIDTIIKP